MTAQPHTDADVIVIGAGLVGAMIAHRASQQGKRVIVIDALRPGDGATRRAVGIAAPSLDPALTRPTLQGTHAIAALADELGVPHRQTRVLHLASAARAADGLRERMPALADAGMHARWETSPLVVPNGFGGGLSVAPAVTLDAPSLVAALLSPHRGGAGVRVLPETHVHSLAHDGGVMWALCDGFTVSGVSVVLATNAYSGLLSAYVAESARAVRGVTWVSRPLASTVHGPLRSLPLVVDGGQVLVCAESSGRLRASAWAWDGEAGRDPAEDVRRFIKDRAPDLMDETEAWMTGATLSSFDHAPLVGRPDTDGKVVYAVGGGLHGLSLAPDIAERAVAVLDA